MEAAAIGIDLGTTYSCVAVVRDGSVEIIDNDDGDPVTASWVAFEQNLQVIGKFAKNALIENPESVVYDIKRLMGHSIKEQSIQDDLQRWPFKVIEFDDRVKVQVKVGAETKEYFPEEISGMILEYLKKAAVDFMHEEVTDAVITVPAYFNQAQRQATAVAGKLAGLNVLQLLSEPTAAAIAFGEKLKKDNETILVYDLGGGTFDVSIVRYEQNDYRVLAVNGDGHLGGQDFNKNIHQTLINEQYDFSLDDKVEMAKKKLTKSEAAKIPVRKGETVKILRARFEYINKELFDKTILCVEKALNDAKLQQEDIDQVLLIGGSARIPKIQELVGEYFGPKKLNKQINPDEAVATGAAIHAERLLVTRKERWVNTKGQRPVLHDVVPLSLGIKSEDEMRILIPRNTEVPTEASETFSTADDFQISVSIEIREGESPIPSENNLIGEIDLHGIPPLPAGEPNITVTFSLDQNAILKVTAVEDSTGTSKSIEISNNKGKISKEELENMIERKQKDEEEQRLKANRSKVANELENLVYKKKAYADGKERNERIQSQIQGLCEQTLEWIKSNPGASTEELEKKKSELLRNCQEAEMIDI